MPRVMLIVDEFHELFVEDDKIAQECGLLMDRLVRQGRAFGIHVLLGSQTLGGAYSLARSTIGQMAVRIALQCSETDAHLILSEENSAARLLNRPGEAIYNDANGRMEGNNPFQVVWLSDQKREVYLKRIREAGGPRRPAMEESADRVRRKCAGRGEPQSAVAEAAARSDAWSEPLGGPQAWLGEAIAIKDPTSAMFRPQNGSNLLLIGQRDEAALGHHGHGPGEPRGPIAAGRMASHLNGHPAFGRAPVLYRSKPPAPSDRLRIAGRSWPASCRIRCASPAAAMLAAVIAEIAEESQRRQAAEKSDAPAICSSSSTIWPASAICAAKTIHEPFVQQRTAPPSAGPIRRHPPRRPGAVGIHTIVWCDTLNNLNRAVDRQGIREFDLRVLFQMSNADSSNLIDTPPPANSARTWRYSTTKKKAAWKNSAPTPGRRRNSSPWTVEQLRLGGQPSRRISWLRDANVLLATDLR